MSSTLYWRPISKETNSLSTGLKYALQKKYGSSAKAAMSYDDIPYLEGLVHGGVEDAQELINAIEQHEEIEVWESY